MSDNQPTKIGENELLPCPFCGGEVELREMMSDMGRQWYEVGCSHCEASGPVFEFDTEADEERDMEDKARSAWNRRKDGLGTVSVKLEWENIDGFGPDASKAKCAFGWYFIVPDEDSAAGRLLVSFVSQPEHVCMTDEIPVGSFYTFAEAFTAAQSDFETRVKSCLTSPTPTHRHKKRGTEYVLIGIGRMQAEKWRSGERLFHAVDQYTVSEIKKILGVDMREVAIYRSVDDDELWARPREEFEDGRFEARSCLTSIGVEAGK